MPAPVSIALFQPDIAPNVGAIARMCACFGLDLHIIEPAGFPWSHAALRRAGMDYLDHVEIVRHESWEDFRAAIGGRRVILATTAAERAHYDFAFSRHDILLFGRESAGVPRFAHAAAHERVRIPLSANMRSLNVAMSAAILASEALRQLRAFP